MKSRKKKKNSKKTKILFGIEIAVLAVLLVGIFAYSQIYQGFGRIGSKQHIRKTEDLNVDSIGENENLSDASKLHGYTNIALVGIDTRDNKQIDYANSDTMLICSINNDTKKVRLVSIYRDTFLNIKPTGVTERYTGNSTAESTDGENISSSSASSGNDVAEEASSDVDSEQQALDEATGTQESIGGKYNKANAAYMQGSAKQMIQMMNCNLDLNIHDYFVVDFKAMQVLIDDIGGLDIPLLHDEVVHINNYAKETSKVTGEKYEKLKVPEKGTVTTYHLNGVQAVSYARIRYTTGNDPKRTQRQRVVIEKIVEKAKKRSFDAVTGIINDVLPYCLTSMSSSEIVQKASYMLSYEIEKTTGFPFAMLPEDLHMKGQRDKIDCLVPVTLATNVSQLHDFLFDEKNYQPTSTVQQISQQIEDISGVTEKSLNSATEYGTVPSIGGATDELK